MMFRITLRYVFLISIAVTSFTGDGFSVTYWTDAGADHRWMNSANWNQGYPVVGGTGESQAYINPGLSYFPVIDDPNAQCRRLWIGQSGTGTAYLTIEGGGYLNAYLFCNLGRSTATSNGTVIMNGGVLISPRIILGNPASGNIIMNSGAVLTALFNFQKGLVNLDGGYIYVPVNDANQFIMTVNARIDITGGTLKLNGNHVSKIQGYVGSGWITPYNNQSGAVVNVEFYDNITWVTASNLTQRKQAQKPEPNNEKEQIAPDVILSWRSGIDVSSHAVYIGTSFSDVNNANVSSDEFQDYADTNSYNPNDLELNTTYYWRVDEVNGLNTYKGNVWSFTTEGKAYDPCPINGRKNTVRFNTNLIWSCGSDDRYRVYLGKDVNAVAEANTFSPEYLGTVNEPNYLNLSTLDDSNTYYWRVDTISDNNSIVKGDIWHFTAVTNPIGFDIDPNGFPKLNGEPYRGFGLTYHPFGQFLTDIAYTLYKGEMSSLADYNIPYIRMGMDSAAVYHYLYLADKDEFFRRLDIIFKEAEDNGIGIVPRLFGDVSMIPDVVGETCNNWGNPDSKTIRHMKQFGKDILTHYIDSPVLWGLEFWGDEMLVADLPIPYVPGTNTELGTPGFRTSADESTHEDFWFAYSEFAKHIRRYDPDRMLESGNPNPRTSSWHNWQEGTWILDTPEEVAEMLIRDNPDPMDAISIHPYWPLTFEPSAAKVSMKLCIEVARGVKKPCYLSEFGKAGYTEEDKILFFDYMDDVEILDALFGTIFVYEHKAFGDAYEFNITPTNERSYILDYLNWLNTERFRQSIFFVSPTHDSNAPVNTTISWIAGADALSHDVYFGTNFDDVNNASRLRADIDGSGSVDLTDLLILAESWLQNPAGSQPYAGLNDDNIVNYQDFAVMAEQWTQQADDAFKGNQTATTYKPDMDELTTYYWRIDEVNGPNIWKGLVRSFTTFLDL